MIRKRRELISSKSSEELKRILKRRTDDTIEFNGNPIKYFKELDKSLNSDYALYGTFFNSKVELKSKTAFYWPKTVIHFEEKENQTLITIDYQWVEGYIGFFFSLLILFVIMMLTVLSDLKINILSPILGTIVITIAFVGIALYGKWIQNNIIKLMR
jgi:hypothetical protein